MGARSLLDRDASFAATLGVALAVGVTAAVALSLLAFARFGDWLYPSWGDRLALLGFLASGGALLALAAGALLWLALRVLAPIERVLRVPGLVGVFALTCLGWLQNLWGPATRSLYGKPLNLALLGLGLLLAAAMARGRNPWRPAALLALLTTGVSLAAVAGWLNLVHLLGTVTSQRNQLNAALWLGALLVAALGVAVGSRLGPAGPPRVGRAPRYALAAIGILAAVSLAPLYRVARAASEPPSAAAAPEVAAPSRAPGGNLNVILISIDTLRADHMGIYAYELDTTPHIDRFFADAAVFTRMYAQAPWTLPSHVSMLTGQYPSTHGVRYGADPARGFLHPIPEASVTLAEILRDAGYATAAFTGGSFVSRRYGFAQGFDRFDTARSFRMREILDRGLAWLEAHHTRPFFLFLHSFDVHAYQPLRLYEELGDVDYDGPLRGRRDLAKRAGPDDLPPLSPADLAHLEHLYDSELRGTDQDLARLFAALEALGRLDDTALLVTSDHGEEFLEHGRTGHGYSLVEDLLQVPLLVSVPGLRTGARIAEPAQTIDIAPTILELAGVAPPHASLLQGVSLLPVLRGEPHRGSALLFEADVFNRQAALVDDRYKYVHHGVLAHNPLDPGSLRLTLRALFASSPGAELFDLETDPGELHDLSERDPALAARHRERLFAKLRELRALAPHDAAAPVPLTPELAEQLRALGYLE